jgi:phage terminase Nu1 subunit (DNA packaging protein)
MAEQKGYPLTVIAGLFSTNEVEVQRLANDGIIPRPEKGLYDLVASVRSYIHYLRDKPMTALTKADIARHLDMSERNLTEVLRGLNIDYRTTNIDDIRAAYIKDLREKAAGRGGDHQIESTLARTRKDNNQADLYELQIKEKSGELVAIADIEPFLANSIITARQNLTALPEKWQTELEMQYGVKIDPVYFLTDLHDTLNRISTTTTAQQRETTNSAD